MEKKRVSVKIKNPNPLFERWLTEWRDEAASTNSQYCYSKALISLKKYPLPLSTGRSCKVLEGFGDRLCAMLDKKLAEYKSSSTQSNKRINEQHSSVEAKKQKLSQNYVPAIGSGGYAILLAIYEQSLKNEYVGYMLKNDIIKTGQSLSDRSFSKPEPGTYYTAWSSMKTLLNKNLVSRNGNPAKFSLTEQGSELAKKLHQQKVRDQAESEEIADNANVASKNLVVSNPFIDVIACEQEGPNFDRDKPSSSKSCTLNQRTLSAKTISSSSLASEKSVQEESVIFAPGSFDVILLVDTQETSGTAKQKADDPMLYELSNIRVPYEIRHLKIGDYTWICRERSTKKELVLPYIVERKRMDDFGSSIKDGRFHEQKFRLKQCGLQNLIYLVESYGQNNHTGLPMTTLQQAATNTLVQDGFTVKFTDDLRSTAEYLSCLSGLLIKTYKNKTLISCSKDDLQAAINIDEDIAALMYFSEFNKGASKNKRLKVKDLFIKQLLQLKGVSVEKALAIVEKYPTPRSLMLAYRDNPGAKGEKLLSAITYGKLRRNLGPAISKILFQLYTQEHFS